MKIGLDIDDVLAQFAAGFIPFINRKYGTTFAFHDFVDYNSWTVMDITQTEFHKRVYEFYDSDEFDLLEPEENAPESVKKLSREHTFIAVTSRPDRVRERTEQWINKHVPYIKTILHSNQFTLDNSASITKLSLCKAHDISILIEDAPKYTDEVSGGGIETILLNKPWNQEYQPPTGATRANSWVEISGIIDEMTAR